LVGIILFELDEIERSRESILWRRNDTCHVSLIAKMETSVSQPPSSQQTPGTPMPKMGKRDGIESFSLAKPDFSPTLQSGESEGNGEVFTPFLPTASLSLSDENKKRIN